MSQYVKSLVKKAKKSSYLLNNLDSKTKTKVLLKMADYLVKNKDFILMENRQDLKAAARKNLAKSFVDRLTLNEKRLEDMADSLRQIARFPDPVGEVIKQWTSANGLNIKKVRSPIGVVLIIYEARPNVTSDCVGLLFKSNNVGILRGGSDSLNSNAAIAEVLQQAAANCGIKFDPFLVVGKPDHAIVDELLKQNEHIDLVIPRGGETLIRSVAEKSRIPVIKHYKGVCHLFVDKTADLKQALSICVNSKVQRPGVCNAVEKILVHKDIAARFLPLLKQEFDKNKVEMRGDNASRKIARGIKKAAAYDWYAEYLDLIVTVKVVKNIDEAVSHINHFGSHHTDSILTADKKNAGRFTKEVDSACCFVNISTRFSDGRQFGLGAEIGISTDKLHARGPMGVEDLTTYKYVVTGNGQVRE
jgi:glutamate-5-semialdehyde dehydrogenase